MSNIKESFASTEKEIKTIKGDMKFIVRRNESIPIIDIAQKLNLKMQHNINQNRQDNTFVVTMIKNKPYALKVEEIIGVHKVVVKKIEGNIIDSTYFDGAAIIGDGSVSMILGDNGLKKLI